MSAHTEIADELGAMRPLRAEPLRLRSRIARAWVAFRRPFILAVVCAAIITTVVSETYSGPALRDFTARRALGGAGFDFVGWELNALGQKGNALIERPGAVLSEAEQSALVRDYFAAIARIRTLNREIQAIYADPSVAEHAATVAPLEAELGALREQQAARRPAVERTLERQTAAVLAAEGLATPGGVLPPVRYQFTESPNLLIVSPRDRIATEGSYHVDPALPLDRIEGIENSVARDLNVSTLIEGTGGISTYPTMVVEEPNLEWVLSTVAHEWAHTYLFFRPLGRSYYDSGETRTLNETTASIIGDEIAQRVLLRYYPDMVRPDPWPRPLADRPFWWAQNPGRPSLRIRAVHARDAARSGSVAGRGQD